MNRCDPDGNITHNTCSVTISHNIIQHDHFSRLPSTPLSIARLKFNFAPQQK